MSSAVAVARDRVPSSKAESPQAKGSAQNYDAFVSYSHAKDRPVAAALHSSIQRLGKRWYQRRALRVFRDDTSLTASPHLWPDIENALARSRFLILLASPEAAKSPWVEKEIFWWLNNRSPETILIALTEGRLRWDVSAGTFDRSEHTPLPMALVRHLEDEPRWIDLRPYRDGAKVRELSSPNSLRILRRLSMAGRKKIYCLRRSGSNDARFA